MHWKKGKEGVRNNEKVLERRGRGPIKKHGHCKKIVT